MSIRTPHSARVPIGILRTNNGPVEVFASVEWARYFESLNNLAVATATGPGGLADVIADDPRHDLNARDAVMSVDELRNEIASLRGENSALRQAVSEIESALSELRSGDLLRQQVQQLEDELLAAGAVQTNSFRLRIEQIEERLQ